MHGLSQSLKNDTTALVHYKLKNANNLFIQAASQKRKSNSSFSLVNIVNIGNAFFNPCSWPGWCRSCSFLSIPAAGLSDAGVEYSCKKSLQLAWLMQELRHHINPCSWPGSWSWFFIMVRSRYPDMIFYIRMIILSPSVTSWDANHSRIFKGCSCWRK